MSFVLRLYRWASNESVLLSVFLLAIFYGNVYSRVTLPLSIFILPVLAVRLKIWTLRWQAFIPVLACLPVILQFFGDSPPAKADISVYFCFFYSAVVVLVLSRCEANEFLIQNSILYGVILIAFMMLVNAGLGYRDDLDFYTLKNLVATPLGSSNYLAVFLLFGFIVALYARQYLCAIALGGAFMLTFSRTGYGMIALSVIIWLVDTRTRVTARWPKFSIYALIVCFVAMFLTVFSIKSGLPESLSIRVALWHAAVHHFVDYPIIGAPRSEYLYIFNGLAWDPHNSVLNLLLLLGVFGASIYFYYVYKILSLFAKLSKVSMFWRSVFVASVVTLLWSLFEVVLLTPAYDILLASLFGLAISTRSSMKIAKAKAAQKFEPVIHQADQATQM